MAREVGVCALTEQRGAFVRCHLVPEALFPHRDHQLKVVTSDARERPRRRPIGAYDERLVTRAGEDILESYDQYGIRFLRGLEGRVLWRCGASSQLGPELIDISSHAVELRDMVRDGDPGDPNKLSIMAERYDREPERLPVYPFRTRREVDRVDHVALFGGFEIYIAASWPYTDAKKSPRVLSPGEPWLINQAAWRGSGREEITLTSIERNDLRWPGWLK